MELKTIQLTKQYGSKIAVDHLNITLSNGVYRVCLVQMAQEKLPLCACSAIFNPPPLGKSLWTEKVYLLLGRNTEICWGICRSTLDTTRTVQHGTFSCMLPH